MNSLNSHLMAVLALRAATALHAQTNVFPASGFVGVGTASPSFAIDVLNNNYNALRVGGSSTNSIGVTIANSVASGDSWCLLSSGGGPAPVGDFGIYDNNNQVSRLVINASGQVGIGTTTPGNALAVTGEISASNGFRIWNGDNGDDVNNAPWYGLGISNFNLAGATAPAVQLAGFSGLNIETQSGQMVITQAGNVGIGTTAPTAPFEVVAPAGNAVPVVFQSPTPNSYVSLADSGGNNSISSSYNDLYIGGGGTAGNVYFRNGWTVNMTVNASGNVGIGTTSAPGYKLDVMGTIHAHEVIVDTSGADYVFATNYKLMPLSEVEQIIKTDKHLPGIPSAEAMSSRGMSMGDLEVRLLAKIEELTLRQIEQEKQLAEQKQCNLEQAKDIATLKAQLSAR